LEEIIQRIRKKAQEIAEVIRKENGKIHIVTHHDADGISSGAIMYKTLEIIGKKFCIEVVRQLEDGIIQDLALKDVDLFIFTDLGSGQKEMIAEYLKDKKVVIADHHHPADFKASNIYELNCHNFGVDGKDEVSGSGMTYFLCKEIDPSIIEFSEFTLVGAAGDTQKKKGKFSSLNKYLLKDAKKSGRINVKKGLRLFGRFTRPLHKALMYLDKPKIPGVNNNESAAIQMITDLNIPARDQEGDWTKLGNLSSDDEAKLTTEILLRSEVSDNGDGLTGNVYVLPNGFELREFATMLNACGRLDRGQAGLELCVGKRKSINSTLKEYRRRISKYLQWLKRNQDILIKKKNATYLVARDKIDENFIGTIMSIVSKSRDNKTMIMFGFANSDNGVKVSGRADSSLNGKVDIGEAIHNVAEELGGEGGGHSLAAGAKIPYGTELEFIEKVDVMLDH